MTDVCEERLISTNQELYCKGRLLKQPPDNLINTNMANHPPNTMMSIKRHMNHQDFKEWSGSVGQSVVTVYTVTPKVDKLPTEILLWGNVSGKLLGDCVSMEYRWTATRILAYLCREES